MGEGGLFLLFLLFLTLKLTEVIDWSWWWVTAPLWAVPVFFIFVTLPIVLSAAWKVNKESRRATRTYR